MTAGKRLPDVNNVIPAYAGIQDDVRWTIGWLYTDPRRFYWIPGAARNDEEDPITLY